MGGRREGVDDPDPRIELRVGLVDDAERHLAARDEHQCAANVLGADEPVGDLLPHSERDECVVRVAADRHRARIAGRESFGAERGANCKVRLYLESELALGGCDQNEAIAQDVAAGRRLHEVALGEVVHPVGVGGEKCVGRRACFDLSREGGARREGKLHGRTGFAGEVPAELPDGIRQGGCRIDGNATRCVGQCAAAPDEERRESDEQVSPC